MAKETRSLEIVLSFPTRGKEFKYHYTQADYEQNYVEYAVRDFYFHKAGDFFMLYGFYVPMDVKVISNGEETWSIKSCYMEDLWSAYFEQGGEPWRGQYERFENDLIGRRYREDAKQQKQLKAA